MEIYCKTSCDLDTLANALREIFNVRDENRTDYKREQLRVSQDVGGIYYLFEVCGLELRLMSNEGDLLVEEMGDYSFYITVTSQVASTSEEIQIIARHLATVLQYESIDTAVESYRS